MKHIIVSFARCQGITKGHQKVFELVDTLCKRYNAEGFVYFSKTVDKKKNPLSHDYRVAICKGMMPNLAHLFSNDIEVRTIFDMARKHSDSEVTLHIVCGGDRLVEYQYKFDKYNNTDYNYKKIVVHNAGDRTDGVSGTYLRTLASQGQMFKFLDNLPTTSQEISGFDLYCALRLILKLEEIPNENTNRVPG
jgi:hypothetical protein